MTRNYEEFLVHLHKHYFVPALVRWLSGPYALTCACAVTNRKPFSKNSSMRNKTGIPESLLATKPLTKEPEDSGYEIAAEAISYPESSGSLVSGVVARRDSGIMEFLSHESWDSGFIAHA